MLRFVDEDGAAYPLGWARDTFTQRIVHLTPGGQAAAQGVRPGWVLCKIGEQPVRSNGEFERAINMTKGSGHGERVQYTRAQPLLL